MEPSESKKILSKRHSVKRKAELNLTLGGATKRQRLELDSMRELQEERILHTDQDLGWSQKPFMPISTTENLIYLTL